MRRRAVLGRQVALEKRRAHQIRELVRQHLCPFEIIRAFRRRPKAVLDFPNLFLQREHIGPLVAHCFHERAPAG